MNYEQLIEELRRNVAACKSTKCTLLKMYQVEEMRTDIKIQSRRESSLITVSRQN